MGVYISSFFRSKDIPEGVEKWSGAVYQPNGYRFPKAAWTDIRDSTGEWIRPRNFLSADLPAARYRESLYGLYYARLDEAQRWLAAIGSDDAALCCWCPYDKAAQRQLKEWGSFICHTAVVGEFLSTEFKVPVWYDSDRLRMSVLTQKGM